MAGLYFLADRPSPTIYNNVLNGFITSEKDQNAFIEQLKIKNVKVVVYDRRNGPKMRVNKLAQYNTDIDQYLLENYHSIKETPEGWLFMLKNE
jgi:hypothetical protein